MKRVVDWKNKYWIMCFSGVGILGKNGRFTDIFLRNRFITFIDFYHTLHEPKGF